MHELLITFEAAFGAASLSSAGSPDLRAEFDGSTVVILLRCAFRDTPLRLTAPASGGDRITVELTDCRVALSVNGRLLDEDWPIDLPPLTAGSPSEGDFPLEVAAVDLPDDVRLPRVTRAGLRTEELRLPGVNIGDCMPYSDESPDSDGRFHLFYLYDRHHHNSKWGLGAHQWAHVSTDDLTVWDEHPMAVPITRPWEGSICTGSVMRAGNHWYAWYAIRMSDRSAARISCAVSDDLYHFKKRGDWFTLPEAYEPVSARDPKVFFAEGAYHMLVTTTLLSSGKGCLAHLVSHDLLRWEDCGPMIECTESQPECPDWFLMDGRYYLVYSLNGVAHYQFSRSPLDGWYAPEGNTISCGGVPKSALLHGCRIFIGFVGEDGYAGHLVAAEVTPRPDGSLRVLPVPLP